MWKKLSAGVYYYIAVLLFYSNATYISYLLLEGTASLILINCRVWIFSVLYAVEYDLISPQCYNFDVDGVHAIDLIITFAAFD